MAERLMKDSGTEWIGEIPANWNICRLKNVANLYTGNSIKDELKGNYEDPINAHPYISSKDIDADLQIIDYNNGMYVKDTDESFQIAKEGDTLMCVEGGSAGRKKAILNQKVSFVNKLCCFSPKDIEAKYLYYYLMSPGFEKEFNKYIGGLIGGVSVSILKNFCIQQPSKEEQARIADFLDKKVSEIDAVISKTKESIEEYKKLKQSIITEAVTKGLDPNIEMKDSGIKWIKMMPFNWSTNKGKYIFNYLEKPVRENDEVITCFRDGEVTLRSNRRTEGFTESLKEIGYQGIDVGDLVVHGMDGFAGSIGISDSRGKATPVLNNLGTHHNKKYYMYLLRTMAYKGVFISLSTGIRVRTCDTNWGKLKEIVYPIPPVDVQSKIAEYLDDQCFKLNTVISQKEKFLTELDQYKKSLIYEYVTGKKEVA